MYHYHRTVMDINLSDTNLGPLGAQTLADSLPTATALQTLHVRSCSLLHDRHEEVTQWCW